MKKLFIFGLLLMAFLMMVSSLVTAYPSYYYRGSAFHRPSMYYGYGYNGWSYYNPGYITNNYYYRTAAHPVYYSPAWIHTNNMYNYYPSFYGGYGYGGYAYGGYGGYGGYGYGYMNYRYPYNYRVYNGYPHYYVYN